MRVQVGRRLAAVGVAIALAVGVQPSAGAAPVPAPATGTGAALAATPAAFSPAKEARKMDAVKAPKLSWSACGTGLQCATVRVPLDYDKPKGATVQLALLRVKARDQKHRIGTLFVNPGGPGGSAVELAAASSRVFSLKVRNRFDVVGMDPRGIGYSARVSCFGSTKAQNTALAGYASAFPVGAKQEKAWLASDTKFGRACSTDTLARSMSTAEVARDMELMRRAVGDKKLTYLGFSYGTYLGQVYANMFPSRFRAVAVDGVLDPVAWAGSKANAGQPLELRLNSGGGAWKALREILVRCDRAGTSRCDFAAGNPVANLATIAARLKAKPLVVRDADTGDTITVTYPSMVSSVLGALYDPAGYGPITEFLAAVYELTEPPVAVARRSEPQAEQAAEAARTVVSGLHDTADRPRWAAGYDNGPDAFASVTCTDTRVTTASSRFPAFAAKADKRSPYFGRSWLWGTSVCAEKAFTGDDEDAYTGPFNRKTKAPLLYVGNYYDPATNYAAAVSADKRMPNSRLLRSNSFGHTAYGTSTCATGAVDAYLLTGALPKAGKVCVGDVQPFATGAAALQGNAARQQVLRQEFSAPAGWR